MRNTSYSYPVFVPTSGIATSGHLADLAPGQIGLFSRNNYSVVKNPGSREEVFLAMGSTRKFDKIGDVAGYKEPERSSFFKPKDVLNFEISRPEKLRQSNTVAIGFTGGSCTTTIKYECDKNYVLRIILSGSPVLRYFGKPMEKTISYYTGCCADADCENCPDTATDPEVHTKAIVDLINNEVELKQVGIKARYISDTYTIPSVQATGTATVTANAVSAVAVTNAGANTGYDSATVAFTGGGGTGAAGTVTVTNGRITGVTITNGGTGYTSAPTVVFSAPSNQRRIYSITVMDDGSTQALQLIQTNVGKRGEVELKSRTGLYSTYSYCGDEAAPDFTPTQSLLLAVCGVCTAGYNLVTSKDVYTIVRPLAGTETLVTDANKQTYANTVAGEYAGSSNPIFVSKNGASASISFQVTAGTTVTGVKTDTVVKGITIPDLCTPSGTITPISWAVTGTAYKIKRQLKITLRRKECGGADWLSDLNAFYTTANVISVASAVTKDGGSTDCEDCYTVSQWSKGCATDDCLATGSHDFADFGSFQGVRWEVIPNVPTVNLDRKVGISVTLELPETSFANDSFDYNDFYEEEPAHVELAWELYYPKPCSLKNLPTIREINGPRFPRQSGEWVIRQLLDWGAYHWSDVFNMNPRIREAFGMEVLNQVDRKAYYTVYYTKFVEARQDSNTFANQPQIFEPMIIFKEGDPKAADFEKMFGSVNQDVVLNERNDLLNW